jgi:HEAT repeat protein
MVVVRLAIIALVSAMLSLASAASAEPRSCHWAVAGVTRHIAIDLHMGDANDIRDYGGPDLRSYVASIAPTCGRYVVGLLTRELLDPADIVRLYAAQSLFKIGPPAGSAVPALKAALKLDKCVCLQDGSFCMKPSWSSTGAIREAIQRITGSMGNDLSIYTCAYSGSVREEP